MQIKWQKNIGNKLNPLSSEQGKARDNIKLFTSDYFRAFTTQKHPSLAVKTNINPQVEIASPTVDHQLKTEPGWGQEHPKVRGIE